MKCDRRKVPGTTNVHRASQNLSLVESRWKLQGLAQRGDYQMVASYLLRLTQGNETFLPFINLISVVE